MTNKQPDYADLLEQRRKEWDTAQSKAASALAETHAAIAKMPDVRNAPQVGDAPWGAPGIACVCGCEAFRVIRWVTVNGLKYRTQLQCMACKKHRTWDFPTSGWIEPEPFERSET